MEPAQLDPAAGPADDRLSPGTRPAAMLAAFLNVRTRDLADWRTRGLLGRSCDVVTGVEGYDVLEAIRVRLSLRTTRPRQVLDDEAWREVTLRAVRVAVPKRRNDAA